MKFSEHPEPLRGVNFEERRTSFLNLLEKYINRLDLETVWMILRTVQRSSPEAFRAFVTAKSDTKRSLRRQYARQNKERLGAECYADFLYAVFRWRARQSGMDPIQIAARKHRALALHGKWRALGFERPLWERSQNKRRKRMGLLPLERTEFRRLEKLYDNDTIAGRKFRRLVTSILKSSEPPMTPFHYEELVETLAQEDGVAIFGNNDGRLY